MTKPASWNELLKSCNDANVTLFDEAFLTQWSRQGWPPTDDDKLAAAKLHIQLVSRITTQRLPHVDGEEAAPLKSVFQLFGETRDIFKTHPKSNFADAIIWYVLNTHVRPFTAKWHRQNERGALSALDATDIFRNKLASLQQYLIRFNALLVAIRDDAALRPPLAAGQAKRESSVAEEMGKELKWGIHEKLGGLPKKTAIAINNKERDAVLTRRGHYSNRLTPNPSAAQPGNTEQRTNTDRGPAHQPQPGENPAPPAKIYAQPGHAWRDRPHAVALAISGGGIRSATFALGVLVALARRNLLYQFDFLSTVSGGGYLGSFITTFLNVFDPQIGLLREDLPFRREDGEAAALRHVRHHSKYLATGRIWERLQMAFVQVYGMAMNGLGVAYVALVAAFVEYLVRLMLPDEWFWYLTVLFAVALAGMPFVVPLVRKLPRLREHVDATVAPPFVILLVMLAWLGLGNAHTYFASLRGQGWEPWLILVGVIPLLASALLALVGDLLLPIRIGLIAVAAIAAPLLFFGIELAAYGAIESAGASGAIVAFGIGAVGSLLFWGPFDINFTAPHRHYKKKLGEAYLVQLNPADAEAPLRENVSLKLSKCIGEQAPYHLVNCALNVPASKDSRMQGRLTDFFLFSRDFCGSPLTGYSATSAWEQVDPWLDLGTAMAISGAAAAPQMGSGTIQNLSFWLALFNIRLGYWIRNPDIKRCWPVGPPGLSYLLQEGPTRSAPTLTSQTEAISRILASMSSCAGDANISSPLTANRTPS